MFHALVGWNDGPHDRNLAYAMGRERQREHEGTAGEHAYGDSDSDSDDGGTAN